MRLGPTNETAVVKRKSHFAADLVYITTALLIKSYGRKLPEKVGCIWPARGSGMEGQNPWSTWSGGLPTEAESILSFRGANEAQICPLLVSCI